MQGVQSTAAPEEPAQLAREVRELGSAHMLYASGDYVVLVAARPMIPHVMREIGRLREVSFRAVGEGTVDFAGWIGLPVEDEFENLKAWHARATARPSAAA